MARELRVEASHLSVGQAYLDECRATALDEIRAIIRAGSADEHTYRLMLDYPLRRAKGLRPALCIAVCRALGGELEDVLPSAAVLELFHNAFLIHDDIEDSSLQRRGEPALHHAYGTSVALNIGDGLLALTLRPLLANTDRLGLGRALRVLEIVAEMVATSFEGQALELRWIEESAWEVSDADYEDMVRKKTCCYSFVSPGLIGATVARAPLEFQDRLVSFLESIGLAFQIQDDLLNLEEDRTSYGKELAGDLWEGKRTLMLAHALRHASASDRARALEILAKPRPHRSGSAAGLREVLSDMAAKGVIETLSDDAIDRYLASRSEGDRPKTSGDVRFLQELIQTHDSVAHARTVSRRHARAADAHWRELAAMLPPSVHVQFLGWLNDYVVHREW